MINKGKSLRAILERYVIQESLQFVSEENTTGTTYRRVRKSIRSFFSGSVGKMSIMIDLVMSRYIVLMTAGLDVSLMPLCNLAAI